MTVPMAYGSPVAVWPLPLDRPRAPSERGSFGPPTQRKDAKTGRQRWHIAFDLRSAQGHPVVAPEAGTVRTQTFYGPHAHAILLTTDSTGVVLLLGEVDPATFRVQTGDHVERGQHLADVSWTKMLHFGAFRPGTRRTVQWFVGDPPPAELMDPTAYVANIAAMYDLDYPEGNAWQRPGPKFSPAPAPSPAPPIHPTTPVGPATPSSAGGGGGLVLLVILLALAWGLRS